MDFVGFVKPVPYKCIWQEMSDRCDLFLEALAFCTGGSCVNVCLFSPEMTYSESAVVELFCNLHINDIIIMLYY